MPKAGEKTEKQGEVIVVWGKSCWGSWLPAGLSRIEAEGFWPLISGFLGWTATLPVTD